MFGRAGMAKRLLHKYDGENLEQAVRDLLLQRGNVDGELAQGRC